MQTRVSSKGQIVLPGPVRSMLGIRAGDQLDINIEAGSIVLTPQKKATQKAKIIIDPVTGFSALSAGPDAPVLTSKEVEEMLSDFL
jgi:AbrB family looped-hinge helix DNA binding protein